MGELMSDEEGQYDSGDEGEGVFTDLVIKYSNTASLLEPGGGRYGNANEGDMMHKISKNDSAFIIGVSLQDNMRDASIGQSAENDARVMADIFKLHFGMKPSRVKVLTSQSKAKPSYRNVEKGLKKAFEGCQDNSILVVYFSGHGYCKKDNHYLVCQDFYKSESGSIVNGLCVKNFYTWMKKSKAQKILFILDCCFAELFTEALYVEKAKHSKPLDKHLYLLSSSEISEPSISDESWLEHGYMTFFIKHFITSSRLNQVSVQELTHFIRKYSEPLSRFSYTSDHGQICQRPTLAHLGPDDLVEVDAAEVPDIPDIPRKEIEHWKKRLKKTKSYDEWWRERLGDAKIVLGDDTFSYSKLLVVIYLNGLHSLGILLCQLDNIHLDVGDDVRSEDAMSAALSELILEDIEGLCHESHERYANYDIVSHSHVVKLGMKDGVKSIQRRDRANRNNVDLLGLESTII